MHVGNRELSVFFLILFFTFFFRGISYSAEECDNCPPEKETLSTLSNGWVYFEFSGPGDIKTIDYSNTEPVDLKVGTQDCCILDDVVEKYVDDCLIGTHRSVDGIKTQYDWISLQPGSHVIKLLNVSSQVHASGWYYELTASEYTGQYNPCALCEGEPVTIGPGGSFGCPPKGFKDSWIDEKDNQFQLFCADNLEFAFWYAPLGGSTRQVGRCPWAGGQNNSSIKGVKSDNNNVDVKCFLSSFWRSTEPGGIWPFGSQGEPGVIDWKTYTFDVQTETLVLRHFTSMDGPGKLFPDKLIKKAVNVDPMDFNPDSPPNDEPMTIVPHDPCDIDFDGDCDATDYELLRKVIGQCEDSDNYNEAADADHDGCVTETDQQKVFSVVPVRVDIKPSSDPNSINPFSKGVIPVAILTTDVFDATFVDPLSVNFGPNGATEVHAKGHMEDIDEDGDTDLILHFNTQKSGIECGDSFASLIGQTYDGQPIEGSDSINTVGCE